MAREYEIVSLAAWGEGQGHTRAHEPHIACRVALCSPLPCTTMPGGRRIGGGGVVGITFHRYQQTTLKTELLKKKDLGVH